ncbi:DNA polymerase I [Candidatus Dependentiae bacterium]|nr:DNA polymerase I [Candidatus Dependentiae bacterium]
MNLDPQKTVFLIDGSSFLYRAYYSLRPLHTSSGIPVQAVYSFCRMIQKLIKTFGMRYVVLVWDSKGKTTRHELYQAYKATRQAPPSDLYEQKKYIIRFAELIGMCQKAQSGIEADDIMYSIAQERSQEGDTVCLITSDKDMAQMLSERVVMFDPFKDDIVDAQKFTAKKGVPIEKLPFYFALLGDASDNIPGVRGIGDKGALELVTQFASLDSMYANLDAVKRPKVRALLQEQKDNAYLSHKLFLLQYHPSGLTRSDMAFDSAHWSRAMPLFQELGFKSLMQELRQNKELAAEIVESKLNNFKKYQFITVTTTDALKQLIVEMKKRSAFAIDTETTGLNALQADLVGISVAVQEGIAYYLPCGHKTDAEQLTQEEIINTLKPLLEDPTSKKYMHHAKFDQLVLKKAGIDVHGLAFDTLIAARLVARDWQKISLKDLSEHYLGEGMLSYDEVVKANKLKNFSYVPLGLATLYAAADAHQTLRLKKVFEQELRKEKLDELYQDIEFPLIQVLYAMELEGIFCDKSILKSLEISVAQELESIEKQISTLVGDAYGAINLNSPKQVEELLFYHLQLPPQKKSGSSNRLSTDQEVLEALSALHPIPGLILKYRELSKLKNTYLDALPQYINPETGKIHTTFSQTAVATGRLASSEPNLQNIPTGSGWGGEIRAAFKPKSGHVFISADYSQIELRVLAHLSQDQNLIHAFLQGHDIHAETAARLFDVSLSHVTTEQRQIGKRINFSVLYGLTPFGLSQDLKIPFKDAKDYIEKYFAQYPDVSRWMERIVDSCKKNGYVETFWGRRRYVPGIYEKNKSLYDLAKRVAINTVAQGTAADIMKMGMIKIHELFHTKNLDAHIIVQIHDELLVTASREHVSQVEMLMKATLEQVVSWSIPLIVATRSGSSWKEVSK